MPEARAIMLEKLGVTNEEAKALVARHTCHNKWCINRKHIIPGTSKDNTRDMLEAGRWGGGPKAKFTADEVNKIRNDFRPNWIIAKELKVAPSTIGYVKNRQGIYSD